jgi:hypothetical protein
MAMESLSKSRNTDKEMNTKERDCHDSRHCELRMSYLTKKFLPNSQNIM